eukprot:3103816-Rhodomonas_salina.1
MRYTVLTGGMWLPAAVRGVLHAGQGCTSVGKWEYPDTHASPLRTCAKTDMKPDNPVVFSTVCKHPCRATMYDELTCILPLKTSCRGMMKGRILMPSKVLTEGMLLPGIPDSLWGIIPPNVLRVRFAMSGTDKCYAATRISAHFARYSRPPRSHPIHLPRRSLLYMFGTDVVCGATRLPPDGHRLLRVPSAYVPARAVYVAPYWHSIRDSIRDSTCHMG